MNLNLTNGGTQPVNNVQLRFNKSSLGINLAAPIQLMGSISPGQSQTLAVSLKVSPENIDPTKTDSSVQMAMKTELGVAYFQDDISAEFLLNPVSIDVQELGNRWKALEATSDVQVVEKTKDLTALRSKYETFKKDIPNKGEMSFWAVDLNGQQAYCQLILLPNGRCKVTGRAENVNVARIVCGAVKSMVEG